MIKSDHPEYRYWAFVSYSSKNKSWGRWVHRAIEAYGIPVQLVNKPTPAGQPAPKRFRPIFRDRDELPASADLSSNIDSALRSSRYLIVVCSREAAQSKWVNKEIETFQGLGRDHQILAIIVDGEPNAGDERECFPPALRSCEPIAADARPDGDGKINAKLKLLAGMLGVNFDVLKQRDARRRARNMQILLTLSFLVTAIFASLSWYANRQRIAAVEQRRVAVNRMVDLRNLISALMWDMAESLDNVTGPLTIKETLLTGSEGYLLKLKEENPIDKGLLRELALTHEKKGDTLFEQGKLKESHASYKSGFELSNRLLEWDEFNASYQLDVASGYIGMARVLTNRGQLTKAKLQSLNCMGFLEDLRTKFPYHTDVIKLLAEVHISLFDIYFRQGKGEKAGWHLKKSLGLYESLAEILPRSAEVSVWRAKAFNRFAQLLRDSSDYDDALYYCRKSIELCTSVLEDMPNYKPAKQVRASGYLELSKSFLTIGEEKEALYQIQKSLNELEELRISDPDWAMSTLLLAEASVTEANILYRSGQIGASIDSLVESQHWVEEVLALDASNVTAKIVGVLAYGYLSVSLHRFGRIDEAGTSSTRFKDLYRSIAEEDFSVAHEIQSLRDQIQALNLP